MISVDTNVVVRLLIDEDDVQAGQARILFAEHAVWLPKTVILETEWVLRSVYRFRPDQVIHALSGVTTLPNVTMEDRDGITFALEAMRKGIDFADALHLASSLRATEGMVSFDTQFVRRTKRNYPEIDLRFPDQS
jgi:predicted nucleic-acid-binding protein